jgi:hypothetical protein
MIEHGPGERVLFPGEVAQRLGMSRSEIEALVAAGKVETLPLEFGYVIPTREVVRLQGGAS